VDSANIQNDASLSMSIDFETLVFFIAVFNHETDVRAIVPAGGHDSNRVA
jgi:hypothetical protein